MIDLTNISLKQLAEIIVDWEKHHKEEHGSFICETKECYCIYLRMKGVYYLKLAEEN